MQREDEGEKDGEREEEIERGVLGINSSQGCRHWHQLRVLALALVDHDGINVGY